MAAPLITRTPIINDDLTGKTGTIIDNAWKQELYNQIDADVAAVVGAMPVLPPPGPAILLKQLYSDVGSANAGTGGTVLGPGLVMPPLAVTDTIKIVFSMLQAGAAGGPLNVMAIGTGGGVFLIRFDDLGIGRSLAANETGVWEMTIREAMVNPVIVDAFATGAVGGQPGASRGFHGGITGCNWGTGGWTLAIYSSSQGAGGNQYWAWTVLKI